MNIKVSYCLAIFAIINEILIFEIVLMRARREKRSSCSKYSPVQFINWLLAACQTGKRRNAPLLGAQHRHLHFLPHHQKTRLNGRTHNRDYNIMR